jgi:hypothetical protein
MVGILKEKLRVDSRQRAGSEQRTEKKRHFNTENTEAGAQRVQRKQKRQQDSL